MHSALPSILYKLLFKKPYRDAFMAGTLVADLPTDIRSELATIDQEELEKTGRRIASDLLKGSFEQQGGLQKSFPGVFEALEEISAAQLEIVYAFMNDEVFDAYKEIPFAGEGICLEEAFYLFLRRYQPFVSTSPRHKHLLRHEFLSVMMAILAINPHPWFRIRSRRLIWHNGASFLAVQAYPRRLWCTLTDIPYQASLRYLYAASSSHQVVKGPIDALSAALLHTGSVLGFERAYGRFTPEARAALTQREKQFRQLGLLQPTC